MEKLSAVDRKRMLDLAVRAAFLASTFAGVLHYNPEMSALMAMCSKVLGEGATP